MKFAIAITLWFAAATSALGAWRSLGIGEATGARWHLAGAIVAVAMSAWFAFAGWWELFGG